MRDVIRYEIRDAGYLVSRASHLGSRYWFQYSESLLKPDIW